MTGITLDMFIDWLQYLLLNKYNINNIEDFINAMCSTDETKRKNGEIMNELIENTEKLEAKDLIFDELKSVTNWFTTEYIPNTTKKKLTKIELQNFLKNNLQTRYMAMCKHCKADDVTRFQISLANTNNGNFRRSNCLRHLKGAHEQTYNFYQYVYILSTDFNVFSSCFLYNLYMFCI